MTALCMSHVYHIHRVQCASYINGLYNNDTEIKNTTENRRFVSYLALFIDTDTDSQF